MVLYSPEPADFIINSLSPAKVNRIVVDEENKVADVIVDEDQLSLAIGKNGQNVRLASSLTDWQLNIMTADEEEQRNAEEDAVLSALFIEKLEISQEVADTLVQEGFVSLEEVAYVPEDELLSIETFDEQMVADLRQKARDVLLNEALAKQEKINHIADDLKTLEGVDEDMLTNLAEKDVFTRDDLAELSVAELVEITGVSETKAAEVINAARAHWFTDDNGAA